MNDKPAGDMSRHRIPLPDGRGPLPLAIRQTATMVLVVLPFARRSAGLTDHEIKRAAQIVAHIEQLHACRTLPLVGAAAWLPPDADPVPCAAEEAWIRNRLRDFASAA